MPNELIDDIHELEKEVDVLLKFATGIYNFDGEGAIKIGKQPKLDELGVMITRDDSIVYEEVMIDNIGEMEKMVAEAELNGFQRAASRGYPIFLSYGEQNDVAKVILTGIMSQPENQKFIVNTDKIWNIAIEKSYELDEMRKSAGIR